MTVRTAILLVCALLLAGVPAAVAQVPIQPAWTAPVPAAADCRAAAIGAANPPCGYIVPQISLDFPNKPRCRAQTLGGPIDLSQCLALPAVGGSHTEEGVFRFSWDMTQDGTYPADPGQPIVITFSGTSTNPKWMRLDVQPAELTLDAAALVDPRNTRSDEQTQQLWFWYEVPLRVTFERTAVGDDDRTVQRVERSQGTAQVFLKAKSSASGQYYKEAFGVEEFRFNPCANDDALAAAVAQCAAASGTPGKDAPAAGLLAATGVLAGLAMLSRRRVA